MTKRNRDVPPAVKAFIVQMSLAIEREQLTKEQAMAELARYCLDAPLKLRQRYQSQPQDERS